MMPDDEKYELQFAVERSKRYNTSRQRFFERGHNFTTVVALLFGSSTFVGVLQGLNAWIIALLGIVVAASAAIDLAVGLANKANKHADLSRQFNDLEQAMNLVDDPARNDIISWTNRRLEIEKGEPPKKPVLDVLIHNELIRARGLPKEEMVKLSAWRRRTAQFLTGNEEKLRKMVD